MFARFAHGYYRLSSSTRQWLRRHFTSAGFLVLGGIVVTAARVDTTLSVGYQAFTLLTCLLLLAWMGLLFRAGRFEVQRVLPRMASAGTPMSYQLRLRNRSRRPFHHLALWEEMGDPRPSLADYLTTPEPGEEKRPTLDRVSGYYRWYWLLAQRQPAEIRELRVPRLPPGQRFDLKVELTPRRRGWMRFTGLTVGCPDGFGLVRRLNRVAAPDSVLVLPKRYALPPLAMPGTRKYQIGGVAMAGSVGESDEFVALRDYRPGDPLRRIHWRSWAKSGKPIVKEYQDEFFVRHALILDTFSERAYSDLFEEAVSVAASFACSLQTQDSLLDLLFVGPQAYCFTTGRGLAHTEQMLEILAAVRTCQDQPFERLHELVVNHSSLVSGIVLVLLQWDAPRQRLVEQLHALRIPLRVLVLREADAPAALEPGPLRDAPECFHPVPLSQIAETLRGLK